MVRKVSASWMQKAAVIAFLDILFVLASYLLALLPILIFYIVCQKQILNGVVNGAVK